MNVEELISKVECWPNENQTLLLKSALDKDKSAIEAWEEWSSKVDFENTDNGSYRLYPLVYRNLTDLNIESNQIPEIFKRVYRHYWSFSNRLFLKTSLIIEMLNQSEIPILLLKGAPLAINYYDNIAGRPLSDVDIMIKPKDLVNTIAIFKKNGFHPITPIQKNTFKWRHAVGFENNDGLEIDLHLSLFLENLNEKDQEVYWEHSEAMVFFGKKTQTLCPTDHLLHTIVHGVVHNDSVPIRWIADAKMILEKNSIDWDRIVRLSAKNKVSVKILVSLKYLKLHFINEIPEEVINDLQESVTNSFEENEFIEKTKKLNRIKTHWFNYLRVKNNSRYTFPFSFISYLKVNFGLSNALNIPFYILKKYKN